MPKNSEQNGCAEQKHRHIVDTGRTLLHHSQVPNEYWHYAFDTAVYLINRLPTPILHHTTPFQKLFDHLPQCHDLKIFGCLCYPWLRPYTSNKLEPHSKKCIFMGYSKLHKGFYCFDLSSQKFVISRHVMFHE